MFASCSRWLTIVLVTLAGCWMRVHDLAGRPMHADEANQAVKAGELIETGRYAFDPRDHHGPTLYYAAVPVAWIRGETTLAQLSETTVRLVPAIAGTAAIFLLWILAAPLGRWPALAAATFMAVSPPAVYFSRYFIQETLLLAFTLGAFASVQRWWTSPRTGWSLLAGIMAGLMFATKASAAIFIFAAILAVALTHRRAMAGNALRERRVGRHALAALLSAAAAVGLLYSSFGTHPAGLRDALLSYGYAFTRVSGHSGHEKPWWYYGQMFLWLRHGGLVFHQLAFTGLALAGLTLAWRRSVPLVRWAAIYTVAVGALVSFTPYKTPWHAIHLVPGLAILAAAALAHLSRRWWAAAAFGITCATLLQQTRLVTFQRPADARNPYAYVHSSPDVKKFRALAERARAQFPDRPIRIIGEEYWPLPWYLRGISDVGYWSEPPADVDGALVIATQSQATAVRAWLHGDYREKILGLRPGVLCVVFIRE